MIRWAATLAAAVWLGLSASRPACAAVTLTVTPLQGARDIDFRNARSLPEPDTVTQQVRVKVTSTTSSPYKLFLRVNGPWSNLAGKELPIENVRFFVSEASSGATVRHPNPTPMGDGEQELVLSSQSENLLVSFIAQVPLGQPAGDYRVTVSFRVEAQ